MNDKCTIIMMRTHKKKVLIDECAIIMMCTER